MGTVAALGWVLAAVAAETPFAGFETVVREAQTLAAKPYVDGRLPVSGFFRDIDYDGYRQIQMKKERALWHGLDLPFEIEFFHAGFIYNACVTIDEVDQGRARRLGFDPGQFSYGRLSLPPRPAYPPGFAGFRVHAPLNGAGSKDEFLVFLGASYFRGLQRGQSYGLSARALAIDTIKAGVEEFPSFEKFWIVRPASGADTLTLYALLNSPRVAGAYRFTIKPGAPTVQDIQVALFFRQPARQLGLAPFSSMFWYGENATYKPSDFRPEVHDSDGLLLHDAQGYLWRPLQVGKAMRHSVLRPEGLRGFGLRQRDREFRHYQDLEARYHRRPSVWVEPLGAWPAGRIHLIEFPTDSEYWDNVVAYFQPDRLPKGGEGLRYAYRLSWDLAEPTPPALARVEATRISFDPKRRALKFVIDFTRDRAEEVAQSALTMEPPKTPVPLPPAAYLELIDSSAEAVRPRLPALRVQTQGADLVYQTIMKNRQTGGWRAAIDVVLEQAAQATGLTVRLERNGDPLAETWSYLWAP